MGSRQGTNSVVPKAFKAGFGAIPAVLPYE